MCINFIMAMGENGERLEREKMHAMRGSKDLYSRVLGGIGKGSEGQTQLQYFLTLPWKDSPLFVKFSKMSNFNFRES
jgi:hypothetical protein